MNHIVDEDNSTDEKREGTQAEGTAEETTFNKKTASNLKSSTAQVFGQKTRDRSVGLQSLQFTANTAVSLLPPEEERRSRIKDMRMAWFPRPRGNPAIGFKTDAKEGRSCLFVDGVCYLFGGYSPSLGSTNFECFDFSKRLMSVVRAANREPWVRAYHTCCLYEGYLVVYGGETYSGSSENKMLTNEILMYHIGKNEYARLPTNNNSGSIEPRKHHAACVLASHLVVYGGTDEQNTPLADMQVYHFKSHAWKRPPLLSELKALSNHSMTPVFNNPPKTLITAAPKTAFSSELSQVRLEGLYVFGGLDKKGLCGNELKIINTSTEPWSFFDVEVLGKPPAPRCDHCAHFLQYQCGLVVYGGRNTLLYEDTGLSVTDSIHWLDLTQMVWCTVSTQRSLSIARYGFNSFCVDSKLYVFGGIGESNFLETKLDVLEMDERSVHIAVKQNDKLLAESAANELIYGGATLNNIPGFLPGASKEEPSRVKEKSPLGSVSKEMHKDFFSFAPLPDKFMDRRMLKKTGSKLF